MFDVILEAGTVIDGCALPGTNGGGQPRRSADVGIIGEKIAAVGDLRRA